MSALTIYDSGDAESHRTLKAQKELNKTLRSDFMCLKANKSLFGRKEEVPILGEFSKE